jgi:tagatose 6-phosphate kinase
MILTVTLSPVLDALVYLDQLRLHAKNIVREKYTFAGGKGFNVAKALGALGIETTALGFVGRADIELYRNALETRGARLGAIPIAATRTNIKLIEKDTGRDTEINEVGVTVTEAELVDFWQAMRAQLSHAEWVVMSGSLAPNVPTDIYAQLTREAAARGVGTIVDTSGDCLRAALSAKPSVLRINRAELCEWSERDVQSLNELVGAAQALLAMSSDMVVVSHSAEGGMLAHATGCWLAQPPPLAARNPIGGGDVMCAVVIDGWRRGLALPELLRWATALASASVLTLESGAVELALARELEKRVTVRQL